MSKPDVPAQTTKTQHRHRWLIVSAMLLTCTFILRRDSQAAKK